MSQTQTPLGSGFGAASTALEVISGIDLAGKTALVTGGSNGMGLEITRALISAGANVVVPARNLEKARAALTAIEHVELVSLDLMDPASIKSLADSFLASHRSLDILINNAGTMLNPLTRDSRGYESQLSTNHLGHFELAVRLWPALAKAKGARVISVSSRGHQYGHFDFEDPNFLHQPYDASLAYGRSKTANALFAVALDQRGQEHGIRAFSLHPGGVITELAKFISAENLQAAGYVGSDGKAIIDPERNMKTAAQGAATAVWCATSPTLKGMGGLYCENCDIAPLYPDDSKELLGVRSWAIDPRVAAHLWTLSEELTGEGVGS